MCPLELLAVDSNVRIEMEQATRKEVSVAVTQFVLGKGIGDPQGLGMEARKILENDLRLTEMFVQLEPKVYEKLEQKEKGKRAVDLWAWHQVGAQWLIKTEYSVKNFYLVSAILSAKENLCGKLSTVTQMNWFFS
jgi:hypothetical protein